MFVCRYACTILSVYTSLHLASHPSSVSPGPLLLKSPLCFSVMVSRVEAGWGGVRSADGLVIERERERERSGERGRE